MSSIASTFNYYSGIKSPVSKHNDSVNTESQGKQLSASNKTNNWEILKKASTNTLTTSVAIGVMALIHCAGSATLNSIGSLLDTLPTPSWKLQLPSKTSLITALFLALFIQNLSKEMTAAKKS